MTLEEVIDLINEYIVENHNQEITGDILNGVLLAMLQQPNELIGDLSDLTTGDNANIVEAINWIVSNLNNGSQVHVGEDNPNVTPPADFAIGDFYSQIDEFLNPVALYVYTGTSWVNLAGYITKESEQWLNFILSGTGGLPTLVAINENQRFINITGNPSGTSSLGGYHNGGGLIPTSIFWSGMTVKVHNATVSDQVIKHNYSSATIKFLFPKEEDYIIKPNETVTFTYRGGALEFEGIYLDYINIIDFGAVGNGTTESAEFIQNALDYAESNGIRRVYAPTGDYLLEKTIYIPTEIEFYGDGMDKTIFKIDEETTLDTIGMFDGATDIQNFYTPVISTKTTRTGAKLNNILLKDFKIDDIYYDDSGLTTQVCPMLILNTKNSNLENVEFGNVQTEKEQDGISKLSLGVSIVFSENILLDRCVHGFAGYESVSVRFLSKRIKTIKNVYNIDKPSSLAPQSHCMQVARPSSLITEMQTEYGETICQDYISEQDTFNMVSGVGHAITTHTSNGIKILYPTVNSSTSQVSQWIFKPFDDSNNVQVIGSEINLIEPTEAFLGTLYSNGIIAIGEIHLNDSSREISNYVVSKNILNLELNRDLTGISERDITALIGNLRTKFHNAVITDNIINISGVGVREQAVFGFYGTNIIASGNVVNFNGTVSQNMRAFVVEGGDRINVINNSTIGNHAYSLKVNNVESLENLIIGANNFSSITLNNREAYTEVIAYKSDISSSLIPINVFNQVNESSVSGNDGVNLLNPEYGLYILNSSDLQDGNSFLGELILHIDNQDKPTAKVIELFGAEIYNNTNLSDEVIAKVNYKLDFFNPDGDDIDYKLSWQYMASGEVLFGEHTDTIDSTEPKFFELLVTGHADDEFTLKSAYLNRVTNNKEGLLSSKAYKFGVEVKNAIYNNVELGNKIPQFNTIEAIDEFISNLKTAGVWSKLDIFSLFQMNDNTLSDFALYDYKRGAFMTAFGGMGYTINGYKGNGIDGYINTNFNPATSGVNYTLNDASRGMYITSAPGIPSNSTTTVDVSSNSPSSGSSNRTRIANTNTSRINNTENLSSSINLIGVGLKVINRDSSSNIRAYNNTDEYNATATSTSISNATQLLLTSSSGYSDAGFGLYFMGASLTAQNVSDLRTAYLTYLIKIGL